MRAISHISHTAEGGRRSRIAVLVCTGVTLLAGMLAFAAAEARSALLLPPQGRSYIGVTDTGDAEGFREFARAIGRVPPVIETFHPWGNSLDKSMPRWREVRARPVLHITTAEDDGTEVIAPRGIAYGGGDDYLLYLNYMFWSNRMRAYIRPLGEPNRCLNPYAAVDCSGELRGGKYKSHWYRQAFRRIYLILHGGLSTDRLNARLDRLGMPPLSPRVNETPNRLPKAPISVIWSPLPAGSPKAKGNWPAFFYPGDRYTDWVGTDFYSRYPYWRDLSRFYRRFAVGRRKPFALTEWGLWGEDAARFAARLITWTERRRFARMLIYYQDFGSENEFRIQNYSQAAGVLARRFSKRRYPQRAPGAPQPVPDQGGITPAAGFRPG